MAESAALLVDEGLLNRPMRQWMLSVPHPLRYLVSSQPRVMVVAVRWFPFVRIGRSSDVDVLREYTAGPGACG